MFLNGIVSSLVEININEAQDMQERIWCVESICYSKARIVFMEQNVSPPLTIAHHVGILTVGDEVLVAFPDGKGMPDAKIIAKI